MNRSPALLLLATVLSALLAWCGGAPARAQGALAAPPGLDDVDGPSPVVYPAQALPLRMNHRKHVAQLGIACTTCHDGAKTSQSAADSLLPPATRCDGCHGTNHRALSAVTTDEPRPLGQCAFCHVGYDARSPQVVARVLIPRPNLRFNHQKHVTLLGMPCARCHGKVEALEVATRDSLPRMQDCISCHTLGSSSWVQAAPVASTSTKTPSARSLRQASGACATCHLTESNGLLTTSFKEGKLLPPPWLYDSGHDADFIERHKAAAGANSKFCASCHQERFCVDCHDGSVRPRRIHPNDFLSQHPVAARQDNPRCTSCHQQQSFCLTCHQRTGVALSGPVGNFANRGRFHPPKSMWTDGPRSPTHHAWEAQRNLNACVSCHQERDCAQCHATRGVGGPGSISGVGGEGLNPHPAGFLARCRQALRQNARPCLVCHLPSDQDLQRCR